MNLSDRIPSDKRSLANNDVLNVLWLAGLTFVGTVFALLLLQRLGLPLPYVVGIALTVTILSIVILVWVGRTMTSEIFFFANRSQQPGPSGIGGTTDWICGAFLVLFFTASLPLKMVLVPGLMFGLFLQAALFSGAFQRSGVLTLPGFMSWRTGTKVDGYQTLMIVIAMLSMVIVAEWQIALDLLQVITRMDTQTTAIMLGILVALPSLGGGFLSLLLVNSALGMWMLFAILAPAVVTGFFPWLLDTGLTLDLDGTGLEALQLGRSPFVEMRPEYATAPALLMAILVLAAGCSVLPHSLSRLSLNPRSVAATESLGWAALLAFVMISALPLSIGLIGATSSSAKLSVLLENQPVLLMLPYLALLFAAFNVVSVAIFTVSASIVRALRRYRNLNPGEQSVFTTRLLVIVIAVALNTAPLELAPDPGSLFLLAVSLGAAGLFLPMVASIWFSGIPNVAITLSMLSGALSWALCFYPTGLPGFAHPATAGMAGLASCSAILIMGRLWRLAARTTVTDPGSDILRSPEGGI